MRTNIKVAITLLSIFSLASCSNDDDASAPTTIPDVTSEDSFTEALQTIHNTSDINGFTIGVVKNGQTTYQHSFGFQNVENATAYTNQTRQPLGSISKTFIGAAIVKCVSLGYFTLDTPINDILATPIVNPHNPEDVIKVKHLVNHTSGLIDENSAYNSTYYILMGENMATQGASLLQSINYEQRASYGLENLINSYYYTTGSLYSVNNFSAATVGTQYNYSNIAASLAAYIVQEASGMPYETFLDQYVLSPLEMNDTHFNYDTANSDDYATLYFDDIELPLYNSDSFPDGFLKTNGDDMMLYMMDMIKGARGNSETLFGSEYYNMLFAEDAFNHGVFWYRGAEIITHSGADPGLSCDLIINKDTASGFFILTNYDSSTDAHESHFETFGIQITEAVNAYLEN